MAGSIYKDSLGRCDPPSMLYDTIRNPNAPYVPPKQQVVSPDTIESTQQRLNREMMERFKVDGRATHDTFVTVVQVGKYLFLAIMLPPYLCMYGIPRWMFVNLLPQMFHFVKHQAMHVGRFVHELTKRIADLMRGLIQQMVGDSLKMMNKHARNMAQHLNAAVQNMLAAAASAWNRMQDRLNAARHAILDPFKQAYNKSAEALASLAHKMSAHASSAVRAVHNSATNLSQAIQQLSSTALAWIQPPFAPLRAAGENFMRGISALASAARDRALQVLKPLVNAFQSAYDKAQSLTKDLSEIASKWVLEKIESANETLRKHVHRVTKAAVEAGDKIAHKIHEFAAPKIEVVMQGINLIQAPIVNSVQLMWGWVGRFAKKRFKKNRENARGFKHSLQRIGRGMSTKAKNIVNQIHSKMILPIGEWWKWLVDMMQFFGRWLMRKLLEFPGNAVRTIGNLWRASKRFAKRIVWGVRLFIAWSRLIVLHGMELVRELADMLASQGHKR